MAVPGPVVVGTSTPTLKAIPNASRTRAFYDRGPNIVQRIDKRTPDLLDYYLDLSKFLASGESVAAVTEIGRAHV